ncbi:membrane protein of unknown function [Methylocella tundrae]|uniref:Uncharacterized protein n=1 Tax=Methylocella tundrae TaxID=227605 RepID=A0A4U8YXK2_METTU|nr:membrane protein of unknown function [Methylocella tundrae]
MPMPRVRTRIAVLCLLVGLIVWFGIFDRYTRSTLTLKFLASPYGLVISIVLPLSACIGVLSWSKVYFKNTFVCFALVFLGCGLVLDFMNSHSNYDALVATILFFSMSFGLYELSDYLIRWWRFSKSPQTQS